MSCGLPPNLRRDLRGSHFTHTFDREPRAVLEACAEDRAEPWLSERLASVYLELFELGAMHTIETWRDGAWSVGVSEWPSVTSSRVKQCFIVCPTRARLVSRTSRRTFDSGASCASMRNGRAPTCCALVAREVPLHEYRRTLAAGW
jgi:hypothetical protein